MLSVPTEKGKPMKEPNNLTQDAAAALAAGMSYGHWKALHPHTTAEETQVGEIPYGWKICKHCGQHFRPNNGSQRYCDFECQRSAARIRDREYKRRHAAMKRKENQ